MRIIKTAAALVLCMMIAFGAAAEEKTLSDFCKKAKIKSENVQAWLEIPDTNISLPVMQHPEDDGFYLDHDEHGKSDNYGALFTEAHYNAFDFSDPVTVIYGHRMNNGSMFGTLQKYYSGAFDRYPSIFLYMEGEKREYEVFAAVLYSDLHILHYNNFNSPRVFNRFFDSIYATRQLGMMVDRQLKPEPDDQVIILSTCIRGADEQRYLVMAKRKTYTD